MQTILDINDDMLALAKELARRERSSAGKVVSRLSRRSPTSSEPVGGKPLSRSWSVAGFVSFPARPGRVITHEEINALKDIEGV